MNLKVNKYRNICEYNIKMQKYTHKHAQTHTHIYIALLHSKLQDRECKKLTSHLVKTIIIH